MELAETPKSFDRHNGGYEHIVNSVQEILTKLGLTQNESKIYLYLNKNGSKKAKEIAQSQKISRTQIYYLLNSLQNKGMITVISDRVTTFEGIGFEKLFDVLINNELQSIEELQLMKSELCELWEENFY